MSNIMCMNRLIADKLITDPFFNFRHVELTEEDKERLKGSYKVAKKLEKLESK